MKQCPYCGNALADDAKFCVECGKPLPEDTPVAEPAAPVTEAPVAAPVIPAAPAEEAPTIVEMPSKKQMLSTVQYLLLSLLYGIPVIGLVFLFIFGAGHPKNASLKRFSAAMLILRLLFWILVLAGLIVAMVKNGRVLTEALQQLIPAVQNLLSAIFA